MKKRYTIFLLSVIGVLAFIFNTRALQGTIEEMQSIFGGGSSENLGATILYPVGGGTGTGVAPSYGQMLVGNSGGTYTLTATSALGILSSAVQSLNSLTGALTLQGTANRITVTSGGSTITLNTPQDINTESQVQFGKLTVATTVASQFSTGYNTTNRLNFDTDSSGTTTIDALGGAFASLVVSDPLRVSTTSANTLEVDDGAGNKTLSVDTNNKIATIDTLRVTSPTATSTFAFNVSANQLEITGGVAEGWPGLLFQDCGVNCGLHAQAVGVIDVNVPTQFRVDIAGATIYDFQAAALLPAPTNTVALGGTSNYWSDLFLGDGSVINFNSDATLTHATNNLTLSGGSLRVNDIGDFASSTTETILTVNSTNAANASTTLAVYQSGTGDMLRLHKNAGNYLSFNVDTSGTTTLDTVGGAFAGLLSVDSFRISTTSANAFEVDDGAGNKTLSVDTNNKITTIDTLRVTNTAATSTFAYDIRLGPQNLAGPAYYNLQTALDVSTPNVNHLQLQPYGGDVTIGNNSDSSKIVSFNVYGTLGGVIANVVNYGVGGSGLGVRTIGHNDATYNIVNFGNKANSNELVLLGDGKFGLGFSGADFASITGQLNASSTNRVVGIFDQRGTSDILQLKDAGDIVLTVKDGGNVGIGTTTPQWLLNPFSLTAPQLSLSNGAGIAQWTFRNAGGNLYIASTTLAGTATNTPPALSIVNNDRIGIGTSTPQRLFSVHGSAYSRECTLTDGATITFDLNECNQARVTLAGNRAVDFTNESVSPGQPVRLVVCQSTGSNTLTWDTAVRWGGGTAPTLTTAAGRCDVISGFSTQGTSTPIILLDKVLNF